MPDFSEQQIAALRELNARRKQLRPEQAAALDELNSRAGIGTDVASTARAHLVANATPQFDEKTMSTSWVPSPSGRDAPPNVDSDPTDKTLLPSTRVARGVLLGMGKSGIIGTGYHVMKGLGLIDENKDFEAALEPKTLPEKTGKFIENAAEFAGGEAAVNAAVKSIPAVAAAVSAAPKVARIVKGAIVGGGVTAAEGGSPTVGAVLGGGLPAIGAAVESAAPLANALKESAKKSMMQFLAPTKATMKDLAAKVAPALIEKGTIYFTRKGFSEAAAAEADNFGQQIENLWTNLPQGTKVKTAAITQSIDDAITELTPTGPMKSTSVTLPGGRVAPGPPTANAIPLEPAAIKNLKRVKSLIENATDDSGEADAELLRKMRQVWDATVAQKGGYAGKTLSLADSAGLNARKEAANAIRAELAQQFPDIAAVNKQFNFWANAGQVMRETLERKAGQSQPMGQQLMRVAGSAAGARGGVVGAVLTGEAAGLFRKLTTSPAWSTTSAVLKDRLASGIANGAKGPTLALMKNMIQAAASEATQPEHQAGTGGNW